MSPRHAANPTAAKAEPEIQETDHWAVTLDLLPYVWPVGRPELRWRVVWASLALVAAKLITVSRADRLQGGRRLADGGGRHYGADA